MTPLTLILRYTSVKNKEKIENQISHRRWNQVGMSTSHLLMMTMTSVTLSHPSCPPSPHLNARAVLKFCLRGSASETSGPACDCGLSHCFIVSFTVSLREDQSLLKFADCLSVTLFHWVSAVRIYMSRDRLAPWQSAGFRTSAARGPRTSREEKR